MRTEFASAFISAVAVINAGSVNRQPVLTHGIGKPLRSVAASDRCRRTRNVRNSLVAAVDKIFGCKISATVIINRHNVSIRGMQKAIDEYQRRFYLGNQRNELFAFDGIEQKYSRKSVFRCVFQRVAFLRGIIVAQGDNCAHTLFCKACADAVDESENYRIVELTCDDKHRAASAKLG